MVEVGSEVGEQVSDLGDVLHEDLPHSDLHALRDHTFLVIVGDRIKVAVDHVLLVEVTALPVIRPHTPELAHHRPALAKEATTGKQHMVDGLWHAAVLAAALVQDCLLYTYPSPRDA